MSYKLSDKCGKTRGSQETVNVGKPEAPRRL